MWGHRVRQESVCTVGWNPCSLKMYHWLHSSLCNGLCMIQLGTVGLLWYLFNYSTWAVDYMYTCTCDNPSRVWINALQGCRLCWRYPLLWWLPWRASFWASILIRKVSACPDVEKTNCSPTSLFCALCWTTSQSTVPCFSRTWKSRPTGWCEQY